MRAATLYLNQLDDMTSPEARPLPRRRRRQVTDGHNLVGNPNFEAGLADGWSLSAGSSTLAISTTVAHGGTKSLHQSRRSIPAAGPRYVLPTGAARYNFSFWVQHAGTVPRTTDAAAHVHLYRWCGGPAAGDRDRDGVAPNTWTQLTGTAVFPPANAPAGCKLLLAAVYVQHDGTACGRGGQVECPELFVDDVSMTMASP